MSRWRHFNRYTPKPWTAYRYRLRARNWVQQRNYFSAFRQRYGDFTYNTKGVPSTKGSYSIVKAYKRGRKAYNYIQKARRYRNRKKKKVHYHGRFKYRHLSHAPWHKQRVDKRWKLRDEGRTPPLADYIAGREKKFGTWYAPY